MVDYISHKQYVSLGELTNAFGVSRATVHRDLDYLNRKKQITLTRGGARSLQKSSTYELPYFEKRQTNSEEKARIAQAACQYIQHEETIMIDSGTTGYELAVQMKGMRHVLAATNDLMTAVCLANHPDIELIVIGGNIRQGFYTASGYFATTTVENFHFDKVFLSVDSIGTDRGCMITNADEVDIKRGMLACSKEVIVICDHTKFKTTAFVGVCPIEQIDRIITGKELDKAIYKDFLDRGVEIELV